MSYAELYDSWLQHPLLLWVAAALGLWLALSRRGLSRSVRWYCIALSVVSVLDAWLTTSSVPGFGPLEGAAASLVPLAFVLAGDLRYFVFIEIARADGTLAASSRAWARACGWTLFVPVASQIIVLAFGSDDPRVLFLVYETLFVLLSLGIVRFYLPRQSDAVQWTRRVTLFVIGYYALWAAADSIIVATGADVGFLLRIVPNVLYYGGFIAAIARTAPSGPGGRGAVEC